MFKKVLLVGCGQLGSRHLQAVASLEKVSEIHVLDPNPESIELGKTRLAEMYDLNNNIKFYWHLEPNSSLTGGDLCIIATQAKGRGEILKVAAKKYSYQKYLIEKVVAQSKGEYRDLIEFSNENGLSIWVNCKGRVYGIHKYIKTKLKTDEPIIFSDYGGNHGLGNNGVHAADLFVFYDEIKKINIIGARIEPMLQVSKRGREVFDLSGSLYGSTNKGSDFVLSFTGNHNSPDQISIISPSGRFTVDHFQKFAWESYPDSDWEWRRIPINENWMVSHMTKKFASDILNDGICDLPMLEECFPAHEFILNQLLPHFNKLLKKSDDVCPIT